MPKIKVLYKFVSWGMTMAAVAALWVIFRADSWGTAKKFFGALLTLQFYGGRAIPDLNKYYVLPPAIVLLFICCWLLPNSLKISRWIRKQSMPPPFQHFYGDTALRRKVNSLSYPALTGVCLYLAITSISHIKSQFLYFNF